MGKQLPAGSSTPRGNVATRTGRLRSTSTSNRTRLGTSSGVTCHGSGVTGLPSNSKAISSAASRTRLGILRSNGSSGPLVVHVSRTPTNVVSPEDPTTTSVDHTRRATVLSPSSTRAAHSWLPTPTASARCAPISVSSKPSPSQAFFGKVLPAMPSSHRSARPRMHSSGVVGVSQRAPRRTWLTGLTMPVLSRRRLAIGPMRSGPATTYPAST